MERIPVVEKEIVSANILEVVVGTNCPQGGDTGHGGRTLLRIADAASTDMRLRQPDGTFRNVDSIEIVLGGDTECETFIEALEFAATSLRAMRAYQSANGKTVMID